MAAFKPEVKDLLNSSITRIKDIVSGQYQILEEGEYEGFTEEEEALNYLDFILKNPNIETVALDCETSALYPRDGYVLGVSMSHKPYQGVYIDEEALTDEVVGKIQLIVYTKKVVFWNAKFDIKFLSYHLGLKFPPENVEDGMLQHYLLDENSSQSLKQACIKYTNLGDYDAELEKFKKTFCKDNGLKIADFTYEYIPFCVMQPYACKDTAGTIELHNKFNKIMTPKLEKVYRQHLLPVMHFLNEMEENGVPFNPVKLKEAQLLMDKEISEYNEELLKFPEVVKFIEDNGEFNPNSVLQLRKLLFDYIGLQPTGIMTDTGAHSTNAEVLTKLGLIHPVPKLINKLRQDKKIKSTYLDKILVGLDRDNRLRTNFNQHFTTSGRLSSSGKLNMQQLPRDNKIVKDCIEAGEDKVIVSVDLQTAEMYYAACLSGDKVLQQVFIDGRDFHGSIAKDTFNLPCEADEVKELFGVERTAAKAISFGILYGSAPPKVAQTVNEFKEEQGLKPDFTVAEAEEAISNYFSRYKVLKKWLDTRKAEIAEFGFIYSALGRKRRVKNALSDDRGVAASSIRSAVNFLIQSVASDGTAAGAEKLHKQTKDMDVKIFALVHDSVVAEVGIKDLKPYIAKAQDCLQNAIPIQIPGCPIGLDFEIGKTYAFKESDIPDLSAT